MSSPQICGLLAGNPSKLSYAMHTAGFESLGLDFEYRLFKSTDTKVVLDEMREKNYRGLSVTIPHKERVLRFVDEVDSLVKEVGAANTIINDGKKLSAFNTDCFGIEQALREISFEKWNEKIILFGAGGAARAAIVTLKMLGAKQIYIANRSPERSDVLVNTFRVNVLASAAELRKVFPEASLLINATPLGSPLFPDLAPFDLSLLSKEQMVFDMVTHETPLTKEASKNGLRVVYGLQMLLFQALKQFELFTGQTAPKESMEQALYDEAKRLVSSTSHKM